MADDHGGGDAIEFEQRHVIARRGPLLSGQLELAETLHHLAFLVEHQGHVVGAIAGFVYGAYHRGDAPARTGFPDRHRRGFQLFRRRIDPRARVIAGDGAFGEHRHLDIGGGELFEHGDDSPRVLGDVERRTELHGGDFQFHRLGEGRDGRRNSIRNFISLSSLPADSPHFPCARYLTAP